MNEQATCGGERIADERLPGLTVCTWMRLKKTEYATSEAVNTGRLRDDKQD